MVWGFQVSGFRFRVEGVGFGVQVYGFGCGVWDLVFRVCGSGFGV